jgi:hypothetical protein
MSWLLTKPLTYKIINHQVISVQKQKGPQAGQIKSIGRVGVEPTRSITPADFKSAASAISPPPLTSWDQIVQERPVLYTS